MLPAHPPSGEAKRHPAADHEHPLPKGHLGRPEDDTARAAHPRPPASEEEARHSARRSEAEDSHLRGQRQRGTGNRCGLLAAKLPGRSKNPTGHHRCWASINNKDDQLYVISRELFRSRAVVFFVSVRWGQTNSVYQRLFERLSWIENRFTTLGEAPIPQLKGLEAGMVVFGQNWNDAQVLKTQRQNFEWFAWKTPAPLSFYWQFARDADDECPSPTSARSRNSKACFGPSSRQTSLSLPRRNHTESMQLPESARTIPQ